MSKAAVDCVKAWTHSKVKGSTRALLDKIAELIPEGQTMTAPIAIDDLATGYQNSSTREARDKLVEWGLVRVHGGGQGRPAQYELLLLPGAGGVDPMLPLRADLREAPRPTDALTPLFDGVDDADAGREDIRADDIADFRRSWRSYFADFRRCWTGAIVSNLADFRRCWSSIVTNIADFRRSGVLYFADFRRSSIPLDVDDARARDVHTSKNVHTPAAARDGPPSAQPENPPLVILHPWHAWCGPVCVPDKLHQQWVQKGHPAEWLYAFYARTCATLSAAQARLVVDEFKFWRVALAAELAPPDARAAPRRSAHVDIPADLYEPGERRRQGSHEG